VLFKGQDINRIGPQDQLTFRKQVQAVFQDPYACFNPFYRVDHALKFPFKRFGLAESEDHVHAMEDACSAVGLDPSLVLEPLSPPAVRRAAATPDRGARADAVAASC
jgi:peptide/nickel transport system ATP-binding protein